VLATFVIGLREGLEAALIVCIVAAFLRKRGRADLLGPVAAGVGLAVLVCLLAAVGLQLLNASLPHQQQESLEFIVGMIAVLMVTWMAAWMRGHARELKHELETAASQALAQGSGWALVGMACLAVMREGLETAVFLLATLQASQNAVLGSIGAVLGLLLAVLLGVGLYRGVARIDLGRFFGATSLVLVVVAAGLVMTSLHAAHQADWLNVGQQQVLDISGLVQAGSIQSAVLTGMLGLEPRPTLVETAGWVSYVVIALCILFWPRTRLAGRATGRASVAVP
jgi:high-affinity iron transporter